MTSAFWHRVRPLVPAIACLIDLMLWWTDEGKRPDVAVPLITVAVCATLFARARYPIAVLAVHLGWSACVWCSRPMAGLLVALYAVAAGRPGCRWPGRC
jgi:hypothetical protein